jgi:hypothetical protein
MTEMDDLELSQRLRALRVDPPHTGFEARLAERLRAAPPEPGQADPAPPPRREERRGRVIAGPWMRRAPVRLIGATALFLAGAAAALDGGVIEWVQARVQAVRSPEPPPPPPAPSVAERTSAPARRARSEHASPPAVEPVIGTRPDVHGVVAPEPPAPETAPSVPRLTPGRRIEPSRVAAPAPERRPALDLPSVPRLEIDRRHERRADPDTRLGRALAKPGDMALTRERGRDLERIRDIAQARREQAATEERPRPLERLRDRRERLNAERRETQVRSRGARQIR